MQVELIRTQSDDGVPLAGMLRRPTAGSGTAGSVDVVIMHHGVGGNFYNPHFFDPMADELLRRGYAVLRVNNRGHDLAYNSPAGRLGAAFESVDDCRRDWKAWIDKAESLGFGRVGLWGHSLGAVKTIYFLAAQGDARVAWAITSSPPRFSYTAYLARPDGHEFQAYLDQARELIDSGNPEQVFPVTIPTSVLLAAKTYLDKYGPEERFDILRHIPNIAVPLLITIGGEEGARPDSHDRFPFGGLAEKVSALATKRESLSFDLIDGADHFYTDRTAQLWSAVERWLAGIPQAAMAGSSRT